jgi:hypothetical protein
MAHATCASSSFQSRRQRFAASSSSIVFSAGTSTSRTSTVPTAAAALRAGLRNRGAWEIPVDGWMTSPICGTQWTGDLAASQTRSWFNFNWQATWHVIER